MSSDFELLDAWKAGNTTAGDRLFRRHFEAIARFFRNKVRDDLEDLIQQTFLGCLEGRDRFRGQVPFRGYLFGVAHRVLGTYLRRKYRERDRIGLDEVSLNDLDPGPSLMLARRREHQLLLQALRELPIAQQVALVMMTGLPVVRSTVPVPLAYVKAGSGAYAVASRMQFSSGTPSA